MAKTHATTYPHVLSASSICKDSVRNRDGEDLGNVHELMIDLTTGRIAYAVLSFGGFLGMGDKLFAIPFAALNIDSENKCFVLDVDKGKLENAEGFDKDNWPNFADDSFHSRTYSHWGQKPYWTS